MKSCWKEATVSQSSIPTLNPMTRVTSTYCVGSTHYVVGNTSTVSTWSPYREGTPVFTYMIANSAVQGKSERMTWLGRFALFQTECPGFIELETDFTNIFVGVSTGIEKYS